MAEECSQPSTESPSRLRESIESENVNYKIDYSKSDAYTMNVGPDTSSGEGTQSPSDGTDEDTICSNDSVGQDARLRSFDAIASPEKITDIKVPIVGYEVMEERAKFTAFKLRVENSKGGESWFVFRRYTDFVRLHSKLKSEYPALNFTLPKKKWFGDNFNPNFLDERIEGLQELINQIVNEKDIVYNQLVRDFFCLDEPPCSGDNVEESKAVVEALSEAVYNLKRKLQETETAYEKLKTAHSIEIAAKLRLAGFVQECTSKCPSCAQRLSQQGTIEES